MMLNCTARFMNGISILLVYQKGLTTDGNVLVPLQAYSMSQPLPDGPPTDVLLSSRERQRWSELDQRSGGSYVLRHFDSGPMQRQEPFAVVHILVAGRAEEIAKKSKGVAFLPPGWLPLFFFRGFCSGGGGGFVPHSFHSLGRFSHGSLFGSWLRSVGPCVAAAWSSWRSFG